MADHNASPSPLSPTPTDKTHTRTRSKFGPTWCCPECSVETGQYVEWPCVAAWRQAADARFAAFAEALREEVSRG